MKFRLNAIVAATAALLAATGAYANPTLGNAASNGPSSTVFVALNAAQNASLTVDLGVSMTSFLPSLAGITNSAGALSGAGTTAVWNFASNTFTVNGVGQPGSFSWSTVAPAFLAGAGAWTWGVIAADGVSSATVGPSNLVRNNNILYTGISNDYDISVDTGLASGAVGGAVGNINTFLASSANTGTHNLTTTGANTATGGAAFLGTTLAAASGGGVGNFSQNFGTNDFMVAKGATSNFYWGNGSPSTPTIYQLGAPLGVNADTPSGGTFVYDSTLNTLTYSIAPIPEPETYAMLIAGLAAVGFMLRRRSAA